MTIYEMATGTKLRTLSSGTGVIMSIAWAPDGTRIVSTGNRGMKLWDVGTGAELLTLGAEGGRISAVAFNVDGRSINSVHGDGTIRVWRPRTKREMESDPESAYSLADGAGLLWSKQQYADAQALFLEAIGAFGKLFGDGHEKTLSLKAHYASRLLLRGQPTDRAEAEKLLLEAYASATTNLGRAHANTRDIAARLSSLYQDLGKQEKAKSYERLSKPWFEAAKESVDSTTEAVSLVRSIKTEGLPALELLVCGEYLLLGEQADAAAAAIQTAIDEGSGEHFYFKSLGWALLKAGRREEARKQFGHAGALLEKRLTQANARSDPDYWTCEYFLDRVTTEQYVERWRNDPKFKQKFACFPWFYIGQRMEIEGKREEAIAAYRKSVELGKLPDAHYIHNWSAYRLGVLTGTIQAPSSAPATQGQ